MKRTIASLIWMFLSGAAANADCPDQCSTSYTECMTPQSASFSVCWERYMYCQDACLPLKPIRIGDPVVAAHWMDFYSGNQKVGTIDGYGATGAVYQVTGISGSWTAVSLQKVPLPGWTRSIGFRLACTEGDIYGYDLSNDPRCKDNR